MVFVKKVENFLGGKKGSKRRCVFGEERGEEGLIGFMALWKEKGGVMGWSGPERMWVCGIVGKKKK